jgi:tRNA (adenine22-N1)-methyltransferase
MKEIKLSPRLMAIVSLCSESECYADIGTDHAFIPIYLAQKNLNSKIYASDLRKGPIEIAKANAQSYGLSERIDFFCADGLDFPNANLAKTIIIAGMGGETIIKILDDAAWCREVPEIIIQPQSKIQELLEYMLEKGFSILDAKLAAEKERIYLIIKFSGVKSSGKVKDLDEILRDNSDSLLGKWHALRKNKAEKISNAQKMTKSFNV